MAKSQRKTSKTTTTSEITTKPYSPQAIALAERAADKVLSPALLYEQVHEEAGAEWVKLNNVMEATVCAHLSGDSGELERGCEAETNFLIGVVIGRRLAVQR